MHLQDWDQINIDFFSNKKDENVPLPEYRLNVLWTDKNLAVAIDQVYSRVSAAGFATQRQLSAAQLPCNAESAAVPPPLRFKARKRAGSRTATWQRP